MKKYKDFSEAKKLIEEGYYLDAEKILKKLQKLEPYNNTIKFELARLWIKSGISIERGEKFMHKMIDKNIHGKNLAISELGMLELRRGNIKLSRQYLEPLLDEKSGNRRYTLLEMLFLEIRAENYEKAYEYFNELTKNDWFDKELVSSKQIKMYLEYKLNMLDNITKLNEYYFYSQIINYDEKKAIEHIKLHLDENDVKQIHSTYLDEINIDKLYYDAKTKITNINPVALSLVDKYVIKYDHPIGMIENDQTSSVRIITLPNTSDIITMYPIHNYRKKVKIK